MSKVSDFSKKDTTLGKLEAMKGKELKELMKTMGGKPGVLKKAELVKEVHKLLITKFDERKINDDALREVVAKDPSESGEEGLSPGTPRRPPAKWTGRTENTAKSKYKLAICHP